MQTILRFFSIRRFVVLVQLQLGLLFFALPVHAQNVSSTAQLEELTSTEVRDRLAAGANTILIPIGATEQSGPFVVLGKHNLRARYLAGLIAKKLGNALVAPVISYVPEGAITPPVAHMRFAGTISIPDAAFNSMLEATARSFKQHGFSTIIFLGDHGGYQSNLEHVAQKLTKEWGRDAHSRVIALREYYRLSSAGFNALLKKREFTDAEIGLHAGLADTALTMAVDKNAVRAISQQSKPNAADGVTGDPRRATAELGQLGVQLIVDGSVAAIRAIK